MDESWWLSCTDPGAMLRLVTENPDHANISCTSDRKLRLFACACCRQVWHLLTDDRSRRAVEVAERFVDGLATSKERGLAMNMADNIPHGCNVGDGLVQERSRVYACLRANEMQGAMEATRLPSLRGREWSTTQAALLRDIIGNPFRPVTPATMSTAEALDWYDWLTPQVLAIAQTIYDARDFAALPVLADALEEAGADNTDLLTHLRSPGPHVRGCHVLDLVLGLE